MPAECLFAQVVNMKKMVLSYNPMAHSELYCFTNVN